MDNHGATNTFAAIKAALEKATNQNQYNYSAIYQCY